MPGFGKERLVSREEGERIKERLVSGEEGERIKERLVSREEGERNKERATRLVRQPTIGLTRIASTKSKSSGWPA